MKFLVTMNGKNLGGLDELRERTDVYLPASVEAVANLRTDLTYVDQQGRHLIFSEKVRVPPSDVTEFAFTRKFGFGWSYIWLRPSEIQLTRDSLRIVANEEAATALTYFQRAARIATQKVV